ncbi:MAG TPA: hypothetical protein VF763_06530 [Candidatus Limnocylindrales bacterium]
MDEMRWERWGAASGFGAILTGAAAIAFERGALSASDSAARIAAHYAANHDALLAQALLFVLGSGFFIWFAASLRSFLTRAEGGAGRLSAIAFGAAVGSTVVTLAAVAFQVGLARAGSDAGQPALVGVMDALFVIANLPLAVMLLAVAVITFRAAAFPAWLGWLTIAAAAAQLLPVLGIALDGGPLAADGWVSAYLPYPLYALWLAGTTIVTVARLGSPHSHLPAAAAPSGLQEGAVR